MIKEKQHNTDTLIGSLLSPTCLRNIEFPNRIFFSPMWLNSAEGDGMPTDFYRDHYWRYAYSGLGGVILEGTVVSEIGRITPRCLGLYNDAQESALGEIVSGFRARVAALGKVPTRIGIQLRHAGIKASMDRPKQLPPTEILLPEDGGWIPLGVFSYHDREFRYIDADGRKIIKEQFVEAAKRAAKANFELIELHWAHGYLFHQYLSSENINAGEGHGGPLENRIKFPLEVFAAVRKAVPDIPLGVRVSFGYKIIDVQKEIEINRIVAGEIAREGADYIAISDRGLPGDTVAERREMHSLALERIRSVAPSLPIMAVGGFGDLHTISDFYSKGISDMFAIGRTLLWNPMLIHEWRHQVGLPYLGPEVYKFSFKGTTNFGPS